MINSDSQTVDQQLHKDQPHQHQQQTIITIQHLLNENKMKQIALNKATHLIDLLKIQLQVQRNSHQQTIQSVERQIELKYESIIEQLTQKVINLQNDVERLQEEVDSERQLREEKERQIQEIVEQHQHQLMNLNVGTSSHKNEKGEDLLYTTPANNCQNKRNKLFDKSGFGGNHNRVNQVSRSNSRVELSSPQNRLKVHGKDKCQGNDRRVKQNTKQPQVQRSSVQQNLMSSKRNTVDMMMVMGRQNISSKQHVSSGRYSQKKSIQSTIMPSSSNGQRQDSQHQNQNPQNQSRMNLNGQSRNQNHNNKISRNSSLQGKGQVHNGSPNNLLSTNPNNPSSIESTALYRIEKTFILSFLLQKQELQEKTFTEFSEQLTEQDITFTEMKQNMKINSKAIEQFAKSQLSVEKSLRVKIKRYSETLKIQEIVMEELNRQIYQYEETISMANEVIAGQQRAMKQAISSSADQSSNDMMDFMYTYHLQDGEGRGDSFMGKDSTSMALDILSGEVKQYNEKVSSMMKRHKGNIGLKITTMENQNKELKRILDEMIRLIKNNKVI